MYSTTHLPEIITESNQGSLTAIVDQLRISNTFTAADEFIKLIQQIFEPMLATTPDTELRDLNRSTLAIDVITDDFRPNSFLVQANRLIGETLGDHLFYTQGEYHTVLEIMIRALMCYRPSYFSDISREETITDDCKQKIASQFFQELVKPEGALDCWVAQFEMEIKKKSEDPMVVSAMLEFMRLIEKVIRYFGTEDWSDPLKEPLNKYVTQEMLDQLEHFRINQDQQNYLKAHKALQNLRSQALDEGVQYLFDLVKRMNPEFAQMVSLQEINTHTSQQSKLKCREDFSRFVLNLYQNQDPFETNQLRRFCENIYRHQHGKIYYEIVCESVDPKNANSQLHQVVNALWSVSQLDTIHHSPQEARSRMPAASIDGVESANFGYAMERSPAYKNWTQHKLPVACADILMDSLQIIVELGANLNIETFLERLNLEISDLKSDLYYIIDHPHPYDRYMITIQLYLLENVLQTPFIADGKNLIPKQLVQVAKSKENVIRMAEEILRKFQIFTKSLFSQRPGSQAEAQEKLAHGLVFGIGFNGQAFGIEVPAPIKDDEIIITFSKAGREHGGNLCLEFVKTLARTDFSNNGFRLPGQQEYLLSKLKKYQSLLQLHVKMKLRILRRDQDLFFKYQAEIPKFEDFEKQLQLDLPLQQLSAPLQTWIKKTANWYFIPLDINIRIPSEMPEAEKRSQYLARELLFDTLSGIDFLAYYSRLKPYLFLHWKNALLQQLKADGVEDNLNELIAKARAYADIPVNFQSQIDERLNTLVRQVHPDVMNTWGEAIQKLTKDHLTAKTQVYRKSIAKLHKEIQAINDILSKPYPLSEKRTTEINVKLELLNKSLQEQETLLAQCPTSLAQLSSTNEYQLLRERFFKDRDVGQCIEPLFARVLGHDRFFAIFISKDAPSAGLHEHLGQPLTAGNLVPYSAIAPCDKRCQLHALGHLYTADMLNFQSADRLNRQREIHHLGVVPERLARLGSPSLATLYETRVNQSTNAIFAAEASSSRQQPLEESKSLPSDAEPVEYRGTYHHSG